jgi:signal peptidase II
VPTILGALTLALDRASKAWVLDTLGPEPYSAAIPLLGSSLRLIYVRNTGVAFSLFQGVPQLFIPLTLLICAGALYAYHAWLPNHTLPVQLSLGLVLGGALGNLADRVRYGYVVDFIQVGRFPVFNVADSAITVGAVLLGLALLLDERQQRRRVEAQGV